MDVKHRFSGRKGFFYMEENAKRIATISFTFDDDHILTVEHTRVDKAFEGRGIARRLVDTVADYARKNHYRIVPHCPYTKKVLEGSSDFKDILYK